jgi:transposase
MREKIKSVYQAVAMPPSSVSINSRNYVYHVGKGYRNYHGKPTSDLTMIGKADGSTGELIPNENYFAIYGGAPTTPPLEVDAIVNFGDFFLLDHVAKDTGLTRVLQNVFGNVGDEVLLLAIYMALTGNALYRCDAWCRENLTGRDGAITSQRCSRILEALDEKKRLEFFRAWVNARQQHEYLAYDVTSISSYSRGNGLVEYGYNRDGEDMPQINLGMYYGEESMLPIFYCAYKGSIVDKSHLRYMMQYNKRLGIKEVCFVMDRGFYSESNVQELAFEHKFIVGMPNGLNLSKDIISKYGQQVTSSRYDIGLTGVKGIAVEDERLGFRSKIHLFFTNGKIAGEERLLKEKLARWERELGEGKAVKAAEGYFTVGKGGDGSASVVREYDAIDEKVHNLGYFLMMTTDMKKTPGMILDIYRRKDIIEKCFDELKNDMDLRRLRVHSETMMEGKTFIAFIGLILRTYIHNKLRDYLDANQPMSMAQVFDELRMIKVVKARSGMLLRNPMTKKQRTMLEQFGITDEKLGKAMREYAGINPFFDE